MSIRFFLAFGTLYFVAAIADEAVESDNEARYQNASILRESFERPLQKELLESGLSPRNAEIATQNMLNALIECWNSDRNTVTRSEPEITTVRLGGETIVTYETPCMNTFLADVDEVAR